VCHRLAHRTDRGDPAWAGRGLRVLRLRAGRTLVGQPEDRGDPPVPGPGTGAASALRGAGVALSLHAEVLLAGHGDGEAARGEAGVRPAAAVGHAGSARRRLCRVEYASALLFSEGSR